MHGISSKSCPLTDVRNLLWSRNICCMCVCATWCCCANGRFSLIEKLKLLLILMLLCCMFAFGQPLTRLLPLAMVHPMLLRTVLLRPSHLFWPRYLRRCSAGWLRKWLRYVALPTANRILHFARMRIAVCTANRKSIKVGLLRSRRQHQSVTLPEPILEEFFHFCIFD